MALIEVKGAFWRLECAGAAETLMAAVAARMMDVKSMFAVFGLLFC